jgi:hypothetical protein
MSEWRPIETAPQGGTPILVCRDNGGGWEVHVVWWARYVDENPWQSDWSAYPEDSFDYWTPLPAPPSRESGGGCGR